MKRLVFGVRPGKYSKKDVTVEEVAIWNEYGTENAPPRPAFRMGLEASIDRNRKMIDAQLKNITRLVLTGRKADINKNLTVLLTQIGKTAVKETKQIIESGSTAPNAPTTIARKGFDHPLYETGLLLKSVDYEVTE